MVHHVPRKKVDLGALLKVWCHCRSGKLGSTVKCNEILVCSFYLFEILLGVIEVLGNSIYKGKNMKRGHLHQD